MDQLSRVIDYRPVGNKKNQHRFQHPFGIDNDDREDNFGDSVQETENEKPFYHNLVMTGKYKLLQFI